MIDENFTEFLDDELGWIMPEQQAKYRKLFKEFGFDDRNQYFIDFWVTYSDEIYGKQDIQLIWRWIQNILTAVKPQF